VIPSSLDRRVAQNKRKSGEKHGNMSRKTTFSTPGSKGLSKNALWKKPTANRAPDESGAWWILE
jgi:hypothetical protein